MPFSRRYVLVVKAAVAEVVAALMVITIETQ